MKHLIITANVCILLTAIVAAGCGESTSRVRPRAIATEAIEPARSESSATVDSAAPPVIPSLEGERLAVSTAGSPEVIEEPLEAVATPAISVTPVESVSAAAPLEILELTMASGIERHHPVGAAERFVIDGTSLYAFMRVANRSSEDQTVVISYERADGITVGPARLNVPADSRGWRTFTRTQWLRHPGQWTVVVQTTDGVVLGSTEFRLES